MSSKLMENYSLEMTARDVDSLREATDSIPPGTSISITYLPGEDMSSRVTAASVVKQLGFAPVPHISARRLSSHEDLTTFLELLQRDVGIDRVFVVAGDPREPLGPFEDALSIIASGELRKVGVATVGISGYPEGHPDIPPPKLWEALKAKHRALTEAGHGIQIVTQFSFDSGPVLQWLERVRQDADIDATVRVGIPGPASMRTLLRFAARCGVGVSARVMSKYGTSITKLLSATGPEELIAALSQRLNPRVHGDVKFHFYPFGGLMKTAEWARNYHSIAAAGA